MGFLCVALPLLALFAHFRLDHDKVVGLHGQTAIAVLLLTLAILAMGVIATALSTVFSFVVNLTVSFFFFMLGLMSSYLFGIPASEGNVVAKMFYAIIPNWQEFWMADPISVGTTITWSYVNNCFVYFFYLVSIFILIAVMLFQEREVGRHNIR
ncbi:MAG: hypothetical protein HRT88_15805 [Lentisphaeraceae bacterium]|nr:hypothetical protein [Lentisphaeraceae bacterium]